MSKPVREPAEQVLNIFLGKQKKASYTTVINRRAIIIGINSVTQNLCADEAVLQTVNDVENHQCLVVLSRLLSGQQIATNALASQRLRRKCLAMCIDSMCGSSVRNNLAKRCN